MKINWNVQPSGNGIFASITSLTKRGIVREDEIMLCVYQCVITKKYIQMVWIAGSRSKQSQSEHDCCISAMVNAELAAVNLIDEIAATSAIWQEA
jgi:hypothetical protein